MKKKVFDFASVNKDSSLQVSDVIELRDFSPYIPETQNPQRIPWATKNYYLLDGTFGKMLHVDTRMDLKNIPLDEVEHSTRKMPEVLEIKLPFNGKFAIYAGIPVVSNDVAGVDLALNDETFIVVAPTFGGRHGRFLGEKGREYMMLWRKAELKDSVLKIRIPHGIFSVGLLGQVTAYLSALRFVKLDDDDTLELFTDKADKNFIMICDGFSHYHGFGIVGECIDLRLPKAYEKSDVNIFMAQITGPLLWKSEINSYSFEELTPDLYNGKRNGDVRAAKYVRDAIENGYDVFSKQTEACHDRGMEMHLSIRANLYWAEGDAKYLSGIDLMNGRWWREHPECRLPNSPQLDYGNKEVQKYYLSVYRDALERFDLDGINLDLTRWPKCLDSKYHSPDVLVGFCKELRALADEFGKLRNKKIKVSLCMVEFYHSYCTLQDQAIDFEALCASGSLDFICLQAQSLKKYVDIAHKYGVKLHGSIDTESPYYNNNNNDPLWALPDGTVLDDPCAGEEYLDEHPVGTVPAPFEHYSTMNGYYEEGADGIAKINDFNGTLYFRDCGHSALVRQHAENQTVYGQVPEQYIFIK